MVLHLMSAAVIVPCSFMIKTCPAWLFKVGYEGPNTERGVPLT